MRTSFIETLFECAKHDPRVFLISVDLGFSVLEKFFEAFPDRSLNVGVQEQNAVSVAAGLAKSGKIVYVYSIIPFVTMRCFEQVRVDAAYFNVPVRLVGVGAGYSYGALGPTHHGLEDLALMRALPNMTVLCPGDPLETAVLTKASITHPGPIYLRLGKGGEPCVHQKLPDLKIGSLFEVACGKHLTLFTTSNMLHTGAMLVSEFKQDGIDAALVSCHTLKPLNLEDVKKYLLHGAPLITLEEHSRIGGLGSALAEIIADTGIKVPFKRFAMPDLFTHKVGSREFLLNQYGLDVSSLKNEITQFVKNSP